MSNNKKVISKSRSQRQLRVGEQVRHELAKILQRGRFKNEELTNNANLITVTEVRISPDLKNARVYVMPLGGKNIDVLLPALNDQAKYMQYELAQSLGLKNTPRLSFVTDESFGEADRIENILYEIERKKFLKEKAAAAEANAADTTTNDTGDTGNTGNTGNTSDDDEDES